MLWVSFTPASSPGCSVARAGALHPSGLQLVPPYDLPIVGAGGRLPGDEGRRGLLPSRLLAFQDHFTLAIVLPPYSHCWSQPTVGAPAPRVPPLS